MTTPSVRSLSLPKAIRPMLARLVRQPFNSPDHIFEIKWDGIRALAFIEDREFKLLSRNSKDLGPMFPELSELPAHVKGNRVVLDGELVCLDDLGRSSYGRLHQRLENPHSRRAQATAVQFIAFDLLYLDGQPVMREPLSNRKNYLRDTLEPSEIAQPCDFIENDGEAFFHATCEHGLEGIVAKDKSGLYFPGKRSRSWLKVKRLRECEFVIGGYTFHGTKKASFSSLLLGLYDNDKQLVYVGQVSEGISQPLAGELSSALREIHSDDCPFESPPAVPRFIFWCHPELVCQVDYGEFTEDGVLAYPMFKGLREDKPPADCMIADAPGWPSLLADFA